MLTRGIVIVMVVVIVMGIVRVRVRSSGFGMRRMGPELHDGAMMMRIELNPLHPTVINS